MRLLIAASVPQERGTASTLMFEPGLKVDQMNGELSPILDPMKYSAAYLYNLMWQSVYQWTKEGGWKKIC
jgi:hypothetical protein